MTAFTAPFEPHEKVRNKAPGDSKEIFQITRQMLDEDGTWKVQLKGMSIGHNGWYPANEYERFYESAPGNGVYRGLTATR